MKATPAGLRSAYGSVFGLLQHISSSGTFKAASQAREPTLCLVILYAFRCRVPSMPSPASAPG